MCCIRTVLGLLCSQQRILGCLQDTVVAIRKGGTKLIVSNLDDDAYPAEEYDTDPKQVDGRSALGECSIAACQLLLP